MFMVRFLLGRSGRWLVWLTGGVNIFQRKSRGTLIFRRVFWWVSGAGDVHLPTLMQMHEVSCLAAGSRPLIGLIDAGS